MKIAWHGPAAANAGASISSSVSKLCNCDPKWFLLTVTPSPAVKKPTQHQSNRTELSRKAQNVSRQSDKSGCALTSQQWLPPILPQFICRPVSRQP